MRIGAGRRRDEGYVILLPASITNQPFDYMILDSLQSLTGNLTYGTE